MSETAQPADTTAQRQQRYSELIDNLDPKLKGKSTYGASAARKSLLSSIPVPNHLLASVGVAVPHRTYLDDAADRVPRRTTLRCDDGTTVHLHQDVRESDDDAFGSFGAAEDDTDDVVWTVVGLDDGTVDLTVVGDWGKRRSVPYDEFADEYEPLWLEDGQPKWGY